MLEAFRAACAAHGVPVSTLTDNGLVFTTRLARAGGRNALETELARLGVTQKNGKPNHPQTQGKAGRFHQTLKRWLARQPPAAALAELQGQLDAFTAAYNHRRPHRSLEQADPGRRLHRPAPKPPPPPPGTAPPSAPSPPTAPSPTATARAATTSPPAAATPARPSPSPPAASTSRSPAPPPAKPSAPSPSTPTPTTSPPAHHAAADPGPPNVSHPVLDVLRHDTWVLRGDCGARAGAGDSLFDPGACDPLIEIRVPAPARHNGGMRDTPFFIRVFRPSGREGGRVLGHPRELPLNGARSR